MINFSAISKNSILGKSLRGALKIIPQNTILPILQGKLRGKKWIIGSGVFGYWLGTYELEKQKVFERMVKEGDVIYDIGAHVGFYSLLSAELTGSSGKVFSFEPLPENFRYLEKHIKINGYKNIFPFETAVDYKIGSALFKKSVSSSQGQVSNEGEIKVKTISLDDLIEFEKIPAPGVLKIDVEGKEFDVLRGASNILKSKKPIIFLSTHSKEIHKKCCNFLVSMGYQLEPIGTVDINKTNEILAKS